MSLLMMYLISIPICFSLYWYLYLAYLHDDILVKDILGFLLAACIPLFNVLVLLVGIYVILNHTGVFSKVIFRKREKLK